MMVFATVVTRSGLVSSPARQFQPSECAISRKLTALT